MRISSAVTLLACLFGCTMRMPPQAESYSWLSLQVVKKNAEGKLLEKVKWDPIVKIKDPINTFVMYKNNDSIRMITAYTPTGSIFRKIQISGSNWRPKQNYFNKFFFIGTYEKPDLRGLYFNFYFTKDWKSLMQVMYTNPGNMAQVMMFSKDSVNILQKEGLIIDPEAEKSEPSQLR